MKTPRTNENEHCIIAVYADDKKGLLGQILNMLNRRNYTISSLNVSRTDIRELVLITMEIELPLNKLSAILRKIEGIIEVYQAVAYTDDLALNKVGFYRVTKQMMDDNFWLLLQKYGATVSKIFEHSLVIQKIGTDTDLNEFYNRLDGEHLLSFCKSGLIAEKSMMQLDKYFEGVA